MSKKEKASSQLVSKWIDRQALRAIQMSKSEDYRQLVAVRATNWGNDI